MLGWLGGLVCWWVGPGGGGVALVREKRAPGPARVSMLGDPRGKIFIKEMKLLFGLMFELHDLQELFESLPRGKRFTP